MKTIVSGVVLVISIGVSLFLAVKEKPQNEMLITEVKEEARLIMSAQYDTSAVNIDSVTLPKAGFLAVRSVDNSRLGQIIEISRYLSAGTHTDISISLGDFYEGGEELIVMAYEDAEDDKVFNNFDQPLKIDGIPLSAYVATGVSVPASITANTVNADALHVMGNNSMATVRYTESGFEPRDLSVPLGTIVHFVNESSQDMWVASNEHPAHTDLPTFDQFGLSSKGSTYTYVFDQVGSWAYHDHLNPEREGVVEVN